MILKLLIAVTLWQIILAQKIDNLKSYSVVDKILEAGYPVEEHYVQTADGYILGVHRIPYGISGLTSSTPRPVVLLQHGLLCSSSDWILLGPEKALAYLLADAGYDVWMGNSRGNTYSRRHAWLSPKAKDFWKFSFHEFGLYDLPAMIDYALLKTGQSNLQYVGHSQGSTAFFVMGAIRPEYNAKVKSMHALAPASAIPNTKNPFIRLLAPLIAQSGRFIELFGSYEFLPTSLGLQLAGSLLCKDGSLFQELCANILFLISGYNSESLNRTLLPDIIATTPAGASVNQIVHFTQSYKSGRFRMFDYGLIRNKIKYGSFSPPEYELQKISAPVAIYYGENDLLVSVKDVEALAGKLGNTIKKFRVPHNKWNHLDFLWAIDVENLLYSEIVKDLKKYQ